MQKTLDSGQSEKRGGRAFRGKKQKVKSEKFFHKRVDNQLTMGKKNDILRQ